MSPDKDYVVEEVRVDSSDYKFNSRLSYYVSFDCRNRKFWVRRSD